MYHRIIGKLEAGTTVDDPTLDQIAETFGLESTVSGSGPSLVSWETLGREGRRHAVAGVRPEPVPNRPAGMPDLSIPAVMKEPACATPVQVYVGLDSAPTAAERVDLALAEMDRAGAWDRSLIMLVSPTGTGYVNYSATASVQYLTRGDCAIVTMQYSKRPSPLSLGRIKVAREQNRLLWLRIVERLRDLPAERRPRVVLFGESLGAHTSQDVFIHWGTLGLQALGIDRALWIGTPYASRWPRRSPARTDPTSMPASSRSSTISARSRRCRQTGAAGCGTCCSATTTTASPSSGPTSSRPGPTGSTAAGLPSKTSQAPARADRESMRWRPVVTFAQLLVDMKNAQIPGQYRAWAHDYRPDLPRFIREIYDLPCSDEQLASIEAAVAQREALRKDFFAGHAVEPRPPAAQPA